MSGTLTQRLIDLAARMPDREALRLLYADQPDVVLSRQQFIAAIRGAARQLRAAGAGRGDLVVIVQKDLLTLVSTFFGASLLGAIPSILPFATEKLDPIRYKASMATLIELSRPAALATDELVKPDVDNLMPENGGYLPKLVIMRGEYSDPLDDEQQLQANTDAEHTALLQHSSGTTGLQKGVALSHRAIFDQLDAYGQSLGFTQDDVVVSWLPLYHDMGLIAGFLMPLLTGARLVLMSPFDWVRGPQSILHTITEHRGTFCWLPNFAYNFCAQKIRDRDLEGVDLSSVRAFVNCSEPVYDASHRMFAERFAPYGIDMSKLSVCYAMAETVFAVSQTKIGSAPQVDVVDRASLRRDNVAQPSTDEETSERLVSCGMPIRDMEVCALDETTREVLPDRRVGEIALRSPYMLNEYYQRTDATEAAFHEGWYLTGDLGYLADGQVYVLGRKKDLLIVGGRNIYPQDIEALASMVEGVHPGRVAVFGVPNQQAGTEDAALVAEVDVKDDEALNAIRASIRRVVSGGSDITIRHIWLVSRGWLIKTSSGKVARSANRDKALREYSIPV
jgi:fatty-acyl-CoA synthase